MPLYVYKIFTDILHHVGNYSKLQCNILRQSSSHVASLLANNYNFFLNMAGLLLGHLQVTLKAK